MDFWLSPRRMLKALLSSTTVCPPTGYRWGLSTQQLSDIQHHFSLSLSQLLQHRHGGGLRRYACLLEHQASVYAMFEDSSNSRHAVDDWTSKVRFKLWKVLVCCLIIWSPLILSVISVTRPLDYEQVPNGMIYLTVMAKDGGNPALNSTVPVTVEVIVSTTLQKYTHTLFQIWPLSETWKLVFLFS